MNASAMPATDGPDAAQRAAMERDGYLVVRGFFEPWAVAVQPWAMGRHTLLYRVLDGRTMVSLPGSELGCPAWFAADAARRIAAARRS